MRAEKIYNPKSPAWIYKDEGKPEGTPGGFFLVKFDEEGYMKAICRFRVKQPPKD